MMGKRISYLLLFWFIVVATSQEVARAQETAKLPSVVVQIAKRERIDKITDLIGIVEAEDKVEIKPRVKGILGPRLFKDGDIVKAGQILFTIEKDTYQLTLKQKEAALKSAEAKYATAKAELDRSKILAEKNAISKSQLDQKQADEKQAEAQTLISGVDVENAKRDLSFTDVISPINGRVGRAQLTPGNVVSEQSGVLATVISDNNVRVLFSVPQKLSQEYEKSIRSGEKISLALQLADGTYVRDKGKLDFVDIKFDAKTDSLLARATFDNSDHRLRDGQAVHVILNRNSDVNPIAIPHKIVSIDQDGAYCFIVNNKDVIEKRPIVLGEEKDGNVAIKSGLNEGEKVIISGRTHLQPGMTVNVMIGSSNE